jgi:hypothetical protein
MALVTLPFSGFYQSLHDGEIDREIASMFSDRDTGCDRNQGLESALFDKCDFRQVHQAYTQAYAEKFAQEFKVKGLKFESMSSPKEYNFETDRVFALVSKKELTRIYRNLDKSVFADVLKDKFTSCDGFSSFYSNDVKDWGPIASWDHNQYGAILLALAIEESTNGEFDQWAEYNLCESFSGNGDLTRWIEAATPNVERLYKIHDYLETRSGRV